MQGFPDFWLDCCNWRVGCRNLWVCTMYGINMKCTTLSINVIIFAYRLSTNLEYTVKLLTFVNGEFCSEMLVTRPLVWIDLVKEIKINCKLWIVNAWLFVLLNIMHEFVMYVAIKVSYICVFEVIVKHLIKLLLNN